MTKLTRKIDRSVKLKAKQLHPNPWNPYANKPDRLQQAIGESIGEFDQIQDIVCRPHPEIEGAYQILDGEGRHRTFEPDDDVYAIVLHGLTDAQAKKVTIVMDETRATADKIELASLLADLNIEYTNGDLISGLPYLQDELDELIKLSEVDWDVFNSDYNPNEPLNGEQLGDRSTSFSFTLKDPILKNYESVKQMISGEIEFKKNSNEAIVQLIEYLFSEYLKPSSRH